ncbi:TetR family transcriptional regulator [Alphaproteobacteria bacterium]|nr:TetR family transcriptional regulator [Alphaproteobacteria bacterium]
MLGSEYRKKRLPRDTRKRLILDEAVKFFSENGFEGQTRILAERLGVTQPLLYRYFSDKDALIRQVFDEVYIKKWEPEWDKMIRDRSRPLADRMVGFYQSYYEAIFKSEFIRIFLFSGLKGGESNRRYIELVQKNILVPFCEELIIELKLTDPRVIALTPDLAWTIHGIVAQVSIRTWVYNLPAPQSTDKQIELSVRSFMIGMMSILKERQAAQQSASPPE